MTPLALWSAVGLVALVATSLWAILARQTGIYVTSGISYVCWTWLAITGGDTALVLAGDTVWVRETVSSLQFVAMAMGIVSLVVFSMRLMGAYPTPQTNAAEAEDEPTTERSGAHDRTRDRDRNRSTTTSPRS